MSSLYNLLIYIRIILTLHSNQSPQLALTCCILKQILTKMFILAPFYLFACTATAMKFYGHTPADEAYINTMNRLAEPIEDEDLSYSSVFRSDNLASKNGSDFLQELGIHDTTLGEFLFHGKGIYMSTVPSSSITPTSKIMPSSTHVQSDSRATFNDLTARTPADKLNCEGGAVEDQFSPKQQKRICHIVSNLVGSGVVGVAAIIDSTVCNDANNGHPIRCSTIVAVIAYNGITLTSNEVNDYCTEYLSANDKKCSSRGISCDTGNKRANVAAVNTQADPNCSGIRGKCKETSF